MPVSILFLMCKGTAILLKGKNEFPLNNTKGNLLRLPFMKDIKYQSG